MKTISKIVISLALVPMFSGALKAADNVTVDVIMSIQEIAVEAIKVFDPVTAAAGDSRIINGRTVYRNTGNGNEDFSVRIASTTGPWTPFTGTTAVPVDRYRLRAVFGVFNSTLTLASFDDDDILTEAAQQASATKFFSNTGSASDVGTPANFGGFNIPIQGIGDNERHLFFRFDAGAAGTTGSSTAFVNVSATATP